MEVSVRVKQAWIKNVQRFKLRCRVQANGPEVSGETHEASVSLGAASTAPHGFSFFFASKPTHLSIFFQAVSSRVDSTSPAQDKELGRCEVTSLTSSSSSEQWKTLLFGLPVPGTNVDSFTGKVTYMIMFKEISSPKLSSLLSDETKREFQHILPSETPHVTVVFHCVLAHRERELVGVAKIGDRSDIRVNTLLQDTSPDLQCLPLLKPVRIFCQDFDCLEIHIADLKTGVVEFSSSRPLSRLPPFKPTHISYDRQCVLGSGEQSSRVYSGADGPGVLVSALYIPSTSRFAQFEGIELAVCDIITTKVVSQKRDVVMGVELVQVTSKGKTPLLKRGGSTSDPPFMPQSPSKRTGSSSSSDQEFHIAVLKFRHKQLNVRKSVVKSYHFFQPSLEQTGGYLQVIFHIYGSSGENVWWSTDSYSRAELTISGETLIALKDEKLPILQWCATSREMSSLPCSLSGVLRWKSRKTKFFTESSVKEALAGHPQLTSTAAEPNADLEESNEVFPDPSSRMLHKTLESSLDKKGSEDIDIVKQLEEFESNLHQMAGDFHTLRRENQCLHREKCQLEEEMTILRSLVDTVDPLKDSDLQQLSKSELILRVGSLQQSLDAEKSVRLRYQEMRRIFEKDISTLQEMEVQYARLQEVHDTEQTLIQSLRSKIAKYKRCSDICRKQESIIMQLESLLAKKVLSNPLGREDAISLLGRENAQLRSWLHQSQTISSGDHHPAHQIALLQKDEVIQSLRSELKRLVTRCKTLESGKGQAKGAKGDPGKEKQVREFELEQKLLVAEAKLNAQSIQLQQNAEEWMQEKAHYELQIAKYKSQLEAIMKYRRQFIPAKDGANFGGKEQEKNSKEQFPNLSTRKNFSF